VSDNEDLGMPRQRAVGKDFNAARAINGRAGCRPEQPSKRRRLDPSCPNLRARLQPHRWPNGWLQIQAARINPRHSRAKLQFDAEFAKVACRALTKRWMKWRKYRVEGVYQHHSRVVRFDVLEVVPQ